MKRRAALAVCVGRGERALGELSSETVASVEKNFEKILKRPLRKLEVRVECSL